MRDTEAREGIEMSVRLKIVGLGLVALVLCPAAVGTQLLPTSETTQEDGDERLILMSCEGTWTAGHCEKGMYRDCIDC